MSSAANDSEPARDSEPGRMRWLLAALALLLVAAVHAPSLRGGFVHDDHLTVERNPAIADAGGVAAALGRPAWNFRPVTAEAGVGHWRPLAHVALAAGHALGGGEPAGFHALSLAMHLLSTWVAFVLAHRLARSAPIAFFAALLFGLHPVHVESVASISAISTPLAGFFALLATDAWVAWRERGSRGAPWIAATWFLLALASHEHSVAVVLLIAVIEVGRHVARTGDGPMLLPLRAAAPFAVVLLAWYVARAIVFASPAAGFDRPTIALGVGFERLLLVRVEIVGRALMHLVWPADLRVFHPFVPAATWVSVGPPVLACAAWIALVVVAWRRRAALALTAALFSPAALLPAVARVQALGMFPYAERLAYLAAFGTALLVALEAWRLLPRWLAAAILCSAAFALGRITLERSTVWRDDRTLFTAAVHEAPRSPFAYRMLGRTLLEEYQRTDDLDDLRSAHAAFQRTLDLGLAAQRGDRSLFAVSDDYLQANIGLALTLVHEARFDPQQDYGTPIDVLRMVVGRYPARPEGWAALGLAQIGANDLDAAQSSLEKALEIDESFVDAHATLGRLWMRRGEWERARIAFERALELAPGHAGHIALLAGAHERAGDDAAALATILRGLEAVPDDPRLLVLRANLAAKHGDLDVALAQFDRVLLAYPDSAQAWLGKGKVLGARGEKTGALRAFQRAAEIDPDDFEAHYNAGAILLSTAGVPAAMPYLVRAYEKRGTSPAGATLRETLAGLPIRSADTYVALATTDADRGDVEGALEWLRRAQDIEPDNGRALFLLGGLLKEKGDVSGALRAWKRASDMMPESLLAATSAGTLLAETGDREEARRYLSKALSIAKGAAAGSVEARAAVPVIEARLAELEGEPR